MGDYQRWSCYETVFDHIFTSQGNQEKLLSHKMSAMSNHFSKFLMKLEKNIFFEFLLSFPAC